MKKYIAAVIVFALLCSLAACNVVTAVSGETKNYALTSDIRALEIQINAADFKIEQAEAFAVQSNLKYLSVTEQNGVLTIVDNAPSASSYTDAALTLYVPAGTVFDQVDIETGAAKMTADTLSAAVLDLELGAGDVHFDRLDVSEDAEIQGGAGQIAVAEGTLRDLTLELGAGELNLNVALLGESDLEFGIGTSHLTLLGSKDDYRVEVTKGLGSVCLDGQDILDFGSAGNGENRIEITGGVGAVHISFRTP